MSEEDESESEPNREIETDTDEIIKAVVPLTRAEYTSFNDRVMAEDFRRDKPEEFECYYAAALVFGRRFAVEQVHRLEERQSLS